MLTRRSTLGLCLTLAIFASGCTTHRQLRRNTINQAQTLSDVYQQQVLDNLAMFVYDPNSLPSFAFPDEGSNEVGDKVEVGVALEWMRPALEMIGLDLGAEREMGQSWTMSPISDPRKLELMRCAYQRAVASCGCDYESGHCPDCEKRWASFYLGTEETQETQDRPTKKQDESDDDYKKRVAESEWGNLPTLKKSSIVTSECLQAPCWFHRGCKKCIPKHCTLVGHYCGVYVWAEQGTGRNELAKLTLAILDYAVNDPPADREKKIEIYLNNEGNLVPKDGPDHRQTFSASVPIDLTQLEINRLLKIGTDGKQAIEGMTDETVKAAARSADARAEKVKRLRPQRSRQPSSRLQLQQRLRPVQ